MIIFLCFRSVLLRFIVLQITGPIGGPPDLRRTMTTLLIPLTVDPIHQSQVLEMLRENIHTVIRTLDGWISTDLVATADGSRIVIHSQWRDPAAVQAMRTDPRMVAYYPKLAALATIDPIMGEVVHAAQA
jgi:quinol monooxygenase YgiN